MVHFGSMQLWVHDQQAALDFYTDRLGFEVRSDVTLPEYGSFRWLTVGPTEQPEPAQARGLCQVHHPGLCVLASESQHTKSLPRRPA